MKKLLAFIMLLCLLLGACGEKRSTQEKVGDALGLDLSGAKVMSESDTHGGFHGDGIEIIQLRVGDIPVDFENRAGWHKLPVSNDCPGWWLANGTIPEDVEDGYWYFYDRHREAGDRYDYSASLARYSYNYTLAI